MPDNKNLFCHLNGGDPVSPSSQSVIGFLLHALHIQHQSVTSVLEQTQKGWRESVDDSGL